VVEAPTENPADLHRRGFDSDTADGFSLWCWQAPEQWPSCDGDACDDGSRVLLPWQVWLLSPARPGLQELPAVRVRRWAAWLPEPVRNRKVQCLQQAVKQPELYAS
jgi:hypothetical protein